MSTHKPRGRPFRPGNSGRPAGSKNRTTQLLEQLAEGNAEEIIQKVLQKAKRATTPASRCSWIDFGRRARASRSG